MSDLTGYNYVRRFYAICYTTWDSWRLKVRDYYKYYIMRSLSLCRSRSRMMNRSVSSDNTAPSQSQRRSLTLWHKVRERPTIRSLTMHKAIWQVPGQRRPYSTQIFLYGLRLFVYWRHKVLSTMELEKPQPRRDLPLTRSICLLNLMVHSNRDCCFVQPIISACLIAA